jgi:MoaA/NifB/PqqE/SkfB family radical SAM enzyme
MKTRRVARLVLNFIAARYLHRRRLVHLELEVTRKCNYRCAYCGIGTRERRELPQHEVAGLLDKYRRDISFVFLTGGEPLLHSHFEELIDTIRRRDGVFLYVTTNGSLLADHIKTLKKVDLVSLSLDGPREIHESHRPRGSFDRVMEALRVARNHRINVGVTCVLCSDTVKRIDEVLDFFGNLKLPVTFAPLNHSTHPPDGVFQALGPARGSLNRALDRVIALKKRTRIVLNSFAALERLKDPTRFKDCHWGRISGYVNADGFFQACCLQKDQDARWSIRDELASRRYLEPGDGSRCESCEQQLNLSLHEVMGSMIREGWALVRRMS